MRWGALFVAIGVIAPLLPATAQSVVVPKRRRQRPRHTTVSICINACHLPLTVWQSVLFIARCLALLLYFGFFFKSPSALLPAFLSVQLLATTTIKCTNV